MFADAIGQKVHGEDYYDQDKRRAVGDGYLCIDVRTAGSDDIQVVGQCHALVKHAGGQLGQEVGRTCEEDGSSLARDTAERKNQSGDDAWHRHWEQHFPDGLCFGCPEGQASLTITVGDDFESLFGRADDYRHGEQSEGERAGYDAVAEAKVIDEKCHAEETENYRRYAGKVVCHGSDKLDERAFGGIFIHIYAAHHAEGKRDDGTAYHQIECADYCRPNAALCHAVGRRECQEVPIDHTDAFDYDKAEDIEQ